MNQKNRVADVDLGSAVPCDPTFSGPVHKRGCTDLICCLLFLATMSGYLFVGVLAWLFGDPRHVLFPTDSAGMLCGAGQYWDRPNMIYTDLRKCGMTNDNSMAAFLGGVQCPTTQVCVSECPSLFWMLPSAAYEVGAHPKDFFEQQYCDPNLDLATTTLTVQEIVDQDLCPSFLVPSTPALGRCFPSLPDLNNIPDNFTLPGLASSDETVTSITDAMGSLIDGFNTKATGLKILEDFASSWHWMLLGLMVAMALSAVLLLLLRYLTSILIWIIISGVLVVGGYGIFHCYSEYNHFSSSTLSIMDLSFKTNISVYLQVKETWLTFLIILSVVEAILLLVLACHRKRLNNAVSLLQEASKAIRFLMPTLFYPLLTFVLVVVCIVYWAMTSLYLATSGAPLYRVIALNSSVSGCSLINSTVECHPQTFSSSDYPDCPSVRCVFYKYDDGGVFQQNVVYLQVFNVFAFLWCVNFVIALGQATLAGAFASYYWSFTKPEEIPAFPLSQAFIRTLQYHLGSLALGSLLLTLFQVPRMILEYLYHKFKDSESFCGRFVRCCLYFGFWGLECFMKFINRKAFVMMAIYGENFFTSGRRGFNLVRRNEHRVVLLDKMTDLLLFLGKLLVVGAVGVLAFFFFSGRIHLPGDAFQAEMLNHYWAPILTVMVAAYLIAQGFFSVYSICVDTLLLCFLEDLERNDGSLQKPYYMSSGLMTVLRKPMEIEAMLLEFIILP